MHVRHTIKMIMPMQKMVGKMTLRTIVRIGTEKEPE
jgi:hypothetical protein